MDPLLQSTCLGSRKDIAYEVGVIPQTDGAQCPTPSIILKKAPSIIEFTLKSRREAGCASRRDRISMPLLHERSRLPIMRDMSPR